MLVSLQFDGHTQQRLIMVTVQFVFPFLSHLSFTCSHTHTESQFRIRMHGDEMFHSHART